MASYTSGYFHGARSLIFKMYQLNESLMKKILSHEQISLKEADWAALTAEELRDELVKQTLLYIAGYQPLSGELLFARSIMNVAYDLYRVTRYLREMVLLDSYTGILRAKLDDDIERCMAVSFDMVAKSVRGLLEGDRKAIEEVMALDTFVDEVYLRSIKKLSEKETVPSRFAAELLLLRHIERIADHSTYIAQAALQGSELGGST